MTIEELRKEKDAPVVIADKQGLITHVNARFEQAFGWAAQDLLGKPLTTIIPKHLHDSHHLGFSRFLATGKPTLLGKPLKLLAVTGSGQEVDAEHTIFAEQHEGQWVFGAMVKPLR